MRKFLIALALGLSFGVLTACEQEGPAERAGENLDQAAQEVEQAGEEATN
jgi:hypothetical protein